MRWSGKLAVVALGALMALPTAWTFQQQPVLAGHATYAGMDGVDPCMAGVVGIVRLRVMWFNDAVLFERSAEDGAAFIYAIEHGAPDPRDQTLLATGEAFEFTDPNGVGWSVQEYQVVVGPAANVDGGDYDVEPTNNPPASVNRAPSANPQEPSTWYTWVVQTGPTVQDYNATGRPYNFVNLVDTCKFQAASAGTITHTNNGGGNWSSDWADDPTEHAHLPGDGTHTHRASDAGVPFQVDLYVGQAPRDPPVQGGDLGVPA